MTLEEAAGILNCYQHRGRDVWVVWRSGTLARVHDDDRLEYDEFEAVAIAEKYLRDNDYSHECW